PAVVHEWHANPLRLVRDRFLSLFLGADEQDRTTVGDGLLDELVGAVDVGQRLLQVDDVDAVALGEDVAFHLRIPAAGLVTEMHAGVEQLLHGDDGHSPCTPRCVGRTGFRRRAHAVVATGRVDRRPGARPTSGPRAITTATGTAGRRGPGRAQRWRAKSTRTRAAPPLYALPIPSPSPPPPRRLDAAC